MPILNIINNNADTAIIPVYNSKLAFMYFQF